MHKGKFITIYGANNLGKTTQARLLAQKLISEGKQTLLMKYALYDLEPTGPLINAILRHPETLDKTYSDGEFQTLQAQNRKDFQPALEKLLDAGITVIAEDYVGTGYAWGLTKGLDYKFLEKINRGLISPDLAIILDGNRFINAKEEGHRYEQDANNTWEKNREIHLDLAKKFNWKIVNANQPINKVAKNIWSLVASALF